MKQFIAPFGYNRIGVGDIVVAKNPTHPHHLIIKRVRGLEGERIPFEYRELERFVPSGTVWVEGDNTTDSRDSRNFGPLPIGELNIIVEFSFFISSSGLIQGQVVARVWPTSKYQTFHQTRDMCDVCP